MDIKTFNTDAEDRFARMQLNYYSTNFWDDDQNYGPFSTNQGIITTYRDLPLNASSVYLSVPWGTQLPTRTALAQDEACVRLEVSSGVHNTALRVAVRVVDAWTIRTGAEVVSVQGGVLSVNLLHLGRSIAGTVRTLTDDRDAWRAARRLAGVIIAAGMQGPTGTAHLWRRRALYADLVPGLAELIRPQKTVDTVLGPLSVLRTVNAFAPDVQARPWLTADVTVVTPDGRPVGTWRRSVAGARMDRTPVLTDRELLATQQVRAAITGEQLAIDPKVGGVARLGRNEWAVTAAGDEALLLTRVNPDGEQVVRLVDGHWVFIPDDAPGYRDLRDQLRRQRAAVNALTGDAAVG